MSTLAMLIMKCGNFCSTYLKFKNYRRRKYYTNKPCFVNLTLFCLLSEIHLSIFIVPQVFYIFCVLEKFVEAILKHNPL